ncbi:hypothetical protein [Halomonas sp. GD1P12]|uniref:hypothetical protein n=1 Tax=Halomonas sp. GD1P12 TaxID=2982691 RepID=UPI0021E3ECB9|nr:hypothetical protein [Halomonas sp. GD1P12]UYG00429.1 hypothetical protein OCT39_02410 [Halomonas sp. GD1P12]
MFAYEKFDVFDEIVSSLPAGSALTYSPLLREGFQFCLDKADKIGDVENAKSLGLSGVDRSQYPAKREIRKIGYFHDQDFLSNILAGFEAQDVTVEKLELIPARFKKVLSNKQREEIDFFDHHLRTSFGCDIREKLEDRFYLVNSMIPKYYDLLKRSGVDALLFRVYYGLNYFPIIFACKMLGITVIDVQHGINGLKHVCYSRFKHSEIDSPFLPDIFWTWSDMATHMLTKGSAIESGATVVEGGGPVYLSRDAKEGNKILYTHQPQSKGIPVPLEEIKRVYQLKKREIVVRPHPLHIGEAKEVMTLLQKEGVKAKLEDPNKLAINDSLKQAGVHITWSSTCALDALNFGVPSVHCSELIDEVEREFVTGLLFRCSEVTKDNLVRDLSKASPYSLGSKERVTHAVSKVLSLPASEGSS